RKRSTVSSVYNRSAEGARSLRIFFGASAFMKPIQIARWLVAAAIAAYAGPGFSPATLPLVHAQQSEDPQALQKRIAALEAGQQAILKELQEIKALLQGKPAVPSTAAAAIPLVPVSIEN